MTGRAALLSVAALLTALPSHAFWWGSKSRSLWLDHPITIDGNADDWKFNEDDDDEGLAFSFANDDKNLYLLVAPHTKSIKAQMAGAYGQDFVIWLDPHAGLKKRIGIRLHAPGRSDTERGVEVVIDTAGVTAPALQDDIEVRMGPAEERGILEARIPLRYLGEILPKMISIGLETSRPEKQPGRIDKTAGYWDRKGGQKQESGADDGAQESGMKRGRRGGGGGGGKSRRSSGDGGEDFSPVQLWIRVTLARPYS